MVRRLIEWAVANPLIVCLLAVTLVLGGRYAFLHINIEAYPDPAPPSSRSSPSTRARRRRKSNAR